jgi:hypothetical protein
MKRFIQLAFVFLFIGALCAAATTKSTLQVVEKKWPLEFKGKDGRLVVYAPQIEKWDGFKKMESRLAVAYAKGEKDAPTLGSFKLVADTEVDHERRLVKMMNLQATDGKFPALSGEQTKQIMAKITSLLPTDAFFISLDRVIASLDRSAAEVKEVSVKNDPPQIFISSKPAILIILDGAPVWAPIKGTGLKWAVNTNWPLFSNETSKKYYLLNETAWLETTDIKGTWSPVSQLPADFQKLPKDDKNWDDVRKNIPGKRLKPEEVPAVYYSETPAELIVTKGSPKLEPINGTNLQWVSNTDSNLFFYTGDKNWYYLVSGRWFRSSSFNGSWEFATNQLPEDFKKISENHESADVLPSVPGTRQADEAVILASIPEQAQVEKSKVSAIVNYAGDPQFKSIEGTSMSYAVNTSESVIKVGDLYYLCYQAVWFVSKSPKGPWEVATSIPKDVYTIPPSSPVHNVTYVYVYDSTPTYVTVGYTSGYYGAYYYGGCVVYGTGWYYAPYYYYPAGYYYPYYYGWPASYGAAAWYNPYTGTYGRGAVYYGPYGGAGYAARYNPATGRYSRGGYAYGPYGAGYYREAYNPRTDTYARTKQGTNYYGNWGSSYVRRGDDWARSGHVQGQEAGAWGYKTSNGNKGYVGYKGDDLYAGKNGNVYRKTDNGWQQWDDGGWSTAEKPSRPENLPANTQQRVSQAQSKIDSSTFDGLSRDASSRSRGSQNVQNYSNWRSSGGRTRSNNGGGRRKR